ncbi:MAG: GrpB family protein [Muribaculaceae bacterium]|nr:GrpB family protein [Muribaculaceae bacterium]
MSGKSLKDLTLKELWELFPIHLEPHNPVWRDWACEEIKLVGALLAEYHPTIRHIGSTAIPDIYAKPIIDILVVTDSELSWKEIRKQMESAGYICMSEGAGRMSFNKGYTSAGYAERVYHLHFHLSGDEDEVIFRDYLLMHADVAKEYEALKLSLLPQFINDRDGYTEAKTEFIKTIMNIAKSIK